MVWSLRIHESSHWRDIIPWRLFTFLSLFFSGCLCQVKPEQSGLVWLSEVASVKQTNKNVAKLNCGNITDILQSVVWLHCSYTGNFLQLNGNYFCFIRQVEGWSASSLHGIRAKIMILQCLQIDLHNPWLSWSSFYCTSSTAIFLTGLFGYAKFRLTRNLHNITIWRPHVSGQS